MGPQLKNLVDEYAKWHFKEIEVIGFKVNAHCKNA